MDKDKGPSQSAPVSDCETMSEAAIDEALEDSFPASDPPPWTLGVDSCSEPGSDPEDSTRDSND